MASDRDSRVLDAQIEAARQRGDFEQLPGHGKPLDLTDLDALSPDQRAETLLLRTCGELLPEVVLAREIREVRRCLSLEPRQIERDSLQAALESKQRELSELLRARRLERGR